MSTDNRVVQYAHFCGARWHCRHMDDCPPDSYEAALRRLPQPHSLALRLIDGNVSEEVICDYLNIEPEGLGTLIALARQKLAVEIELLQ